MQLVFKVLPLVLAAGVMQAATAAAPAGGASSDIGVYMGASIGQARMQPNFRMSDRLGRVSEQNKKMAFKIYGGYRFDEHVGVEGAFAHLNGARYDVEDQRGGTHQGKLSATGLTLHAVGFLPVSESFTLLGKVGLSAMQFKGSYDGRYSSHEYQEKKRFVTTPSFGIGAELKLTGQLAARVEYEYLGRAKFGSDSLKVRTDMISAGLRYAF